MATATSGMLGGRQSGHVAAVSPADVASSLVSDVALDVVEPVELLALPSVLAASVDPEPAGSCEPHDGIEDPASATMSLIGHATPHRRFVGAHSTGCILNLRLVISAVVNLEVIVGREQA